MKIAVKWVGSEHKYYASWKDPTTKKEVRELLIKVDARTEETDKLASIKLAEVEPEIQSRYARDYASLSVMSLYLEYSSKQPQWEAGFARTWLNVANKFNIYTKGVPIRSIGSEVLENYLKAEFKSNNDANKHGTRLKTLMNYYCKHGYLDKNYWANASVPATSSREIDCMLTDDELAKLLAVNDTLFTDALRSLVATGGRTDEILSVTGKEYNGDTGVITKGSFKTQGKGGLPYRLVPDVVRGILDARKAKHGDGYLFQGEEGRRITCDMFRNMWNKYCAKLGIPDERIPYGLRHYFCSMCYKKGIPEFVTAKLMGHASVKMVRLVYGHMEGIMGAFRPHLNSVMDLIPILSKTA